MSNAHCLKMTAVKIQHKNCLQSTLRKKIINTLFAGLGRSVLGKTVPSILGTALTACGLGPYSRPLAQFIPIRTSRPANNIYIAQINTAAGAGTAAAIKLAGATYRYLLLCNRKSRSRSRSRGRDRPRDRPGTTRVEKAPPATPVVNQVIVSAFQVLSLLVL